MTNFSGVQFDGITETINSVSVNVIQADPSGDVLSCSGTTVPTDASSGYAKGCIFIKTDVATGTTGRYENIGTNTSCLFVASSSNTSTVQRLSTQTALTSVNILALNATPITLVAAPGSGKIIVVRGITVKMVTTATAYANGGALEFRYTDASGAKVTADIAAAVVTAGAGTTYTSVAGVTTSLTNVANAAIVVNNATAPFITGTGTAVVTTVYEVITP